MHACIKYYLRREGVDRMRTDYNIDGIFSEVLDVAVLEEIKNIDPENPTLILTEVIELYEDSSAYQLDEIKDAILQNDALELALTAHALKSSTMALGGVLLAEVCEEIEKIAKEGTTEEAIGPCATLDERFDETLLALKAYLQES